MLILLLILLTGESFAWEQKHDFTVVITGCGLDQTFTSKVGWRFDKSDTITAFRGFKKYAFYNQNTKENLLIDLKNHVYTVEQTCLGLKNDYITEDNNQNIQEKNFELISQYIQQNKLAKVKIKCTGSTFRRVYTVTEITGRAAKP